LQTQNEEMRADELPRLVDDEPVKAEKKEETTDVKEEVARSPCRRTRRRPRRLAELDREP